MTCEQKISIRMERQVGVWVKIYENMKKAELNIDGRASTETVHMPLSAEIFKHELFIKAA